MQAVSPACARVSRYSEGARKPVARPTFDPLARARSGRPRARPAALGREPLAGLEHRPVVVGHERDEPGRRSRRGSVACGARSRAPRRARRTARGRGPRRPTAAAALAPAGGAGRYGSIVVKSWPMKPRRRPVGEHEPCRPGRVTRAISRAPASWRGVNCTPSTERTVSKLASANGSASASPSTHSISTPAAAARSAPIVEQLGDEVERGHARARQRGGDRGVARAGGDVEHLAARRDRAAASAVGRRPRGRRPRRRRGSRPTPRSRGGRPSAGSRSWSWCSWSRVCSFQNT